MSKIQLLSGPAIDDALEETAVRHLFRYQLNPATLAVLLLLGAAGFITAFYFWFWPGLGGGYTVAFISSILLGMTFFSMASFWGNFQHKHFVAISDDFLYVGNDQQAWRIHWSMVNRDTLNFDEMQNSRLRGKLYLEAAGQTIDIPLFTPFVFVEDIEGLMFELLQRLEADGGEAPVGAPNQDVDPSVHVHEAEDASDDIDDVPDDTTADDD